MLAVAPIEQELELPPQQPRKSFPFHATVGREMLFITNPKDTKAPPTLVSLVELIEVSFADKIYFTFLENGVERRGTPDEPAILGDGRLKIFCDDLRAVTKGAIFFFWFRGEVHPDYRLYTQDYLARNFPDVRILGYRR